MYKFLFLLVSSLSFGQSIKCLDGIEDIISNKVTVNSVKYTQLNNHGIESYIIDNKVRVYLSNTSSFIRLNKKSKKISFSQTNKNKQNIFLNLDDVFSINFNKKKIYILQFRTLHQGIGDNTFNIIASNNRILLKKWNSSGTGISNAFGIRNHNLFFLNQIRDSLNYYELNNERLILKSKYSTNIKIDSLGQVCLLKDYKF